MEINVNLKKSQILPWITVNKDTEDTIEISVFNGDDAVNAPKKTTLTGKKPFGEVVTISTKTKAGKVLADVTKELTDQTGKVVCELTLNEEKAFFIIHVEDIKGE